MKSVELRRHAEKDPNGTLTEKGIQASKKLEGTLSKFSKVVASESDRAQLTAKLITGSDPEINPCAGMWMASAEKSAAINKLATEQNLMFLEAINKYNDPEAIEGTNSRASELNELIDQVLTDLGEDEHGLIVSHDLSISATMAKRGILPESIEPLEGYIIYENGDIEPARLS